MSTVNGPMVGLILTVAHVMQDFPHPHKDYAVFFSEYRGYMGIVHMLGVGILHQ